jgi:hypothetical protein
MACDFAQALVILGAMRRLMMAVVLTAVLTTVLSAGNVTVDLPGHPFGVAISADGLWLFTTIVGDGTQPGLAIVRRDGETMTMSRVVPLAGLPRRGKRRKHTST